jgi:hypothetical protein
LRHKLLTVFVIVFVGYFIVSNPHGAAATFAHIGAGLASAAGKLGDFFTALTAGGGR